MNAAGQILGGGALVGVGVALGARLAERALPRTLSYLIRLELRLGFTEQRVRLLERQLANAEEAFADLAASFDRTVDVAAKVAYDNGVEEGQAFEAARRQAGLS